jgi:predicted metalloprotease with PDZ domain
MANSEDHNATKKSGAWLLLIMLGFSFAGPQMFDAQAATVAYTLSYASTGSTHVHVRVDSLPGTTMPRTFLIPRAIPMGYGEEPYGRFVSDVQSFDARKSLNVSRADGPRWQVGTATRVEYDVDLARMENEVGNGTDSSRVRQGYVFILGYSVFGFIEGLENEPVELHIDGPDGWRVFSTLSTAGGLTRAKDFYALADSQVAMGPRLSLATVHYPREKDAPLTLALFSETDVDQGRLERLSGEAMAAMLDYFSSTNSPPFQHYTVFLEFVNRLPNHDYGFGMEHLESFHAAMETADAAPTGFPDLRFRYHMAHHIAHAWVPKRCYGEGYYPFTWGVAPKIDTIWFSEGFAQYAAMVAVANDENERQRMLDRRFRSVLREVPLELNHMGLSELSLRASTNYVGDFRIAQIVFSRGGLMAEEMDTRIRTQTHGEKSLRDALRALVAWSAQTHRAFGVEELPVRFKEATGVDTKSILEKWMARSN